MNSVLIRVGSMQDNPEISSWTRNCHYGKSLEHAPGHGHLLFHFVNCSIIPITSTIVREHSLLYFYLQRVYRSLQLRLAPPSPYLVPIGGDAGFTPYPELLQCRLNRATARIHSRNL